MSGRCKAPYIHHTISRLLSPRLCLCCDRPGVDALFLCPQCAASLPRVVHACDLCGLPNMAGGNTCAACQLNPPPWQRMRAPLAYDGITRRLIRDFKFHEKLYIGRALVELLHDAFNPAQVDALIPVPLHRQRLIERGFNQSAEIAGLLARELGIALDTRSLQRLRATEPQSGLSLNRRRHNLRGAFSWQSQFSYRCVAIVDDVITTGSTMTEITRTLQRAGIQQIQVWGLARALKDTA